jgi:hypothetical protein
LNFKLILHLSKILALASVRSRRVKGSVPTGFAKSPRTNLIVGAILFPVTAVVAFYLGGIFLEGLNPGAFFLQISVFLPSLMTLVAVMYGLLFEFSQASAVGSSDIINWLPVEAKEFVLASVLSMFYFLAPILALVFGATFGLSMVVNMLDVGVFSLVLSVLGIFVGAFILEIIRAITNRVSATFYKRSGRTTVAVRMVFLVVFLVAFILISNINFLFTILQLLMGGITNAWFIPILWPSLALISYSTAEILQVVIYIILSVALAMVFLWMSVRLRIRYWVPEPFAIKLKPSKSYTPKRGFLGRLGFNVVEAALIRKDFRGLTRRKEMIVWIAMPLAISLISLFSYSTNFASQTILDRLMFFWGPLIGVFMLAFYLGLTGIGQEGSAFLNLVVVPLKEKEIVKAKLATALFPSGFAMVVVTIFIQILVQPRLEAFIAIAVDLFTVLFECAFVGLALGSRYPDFTEVPRARFIEQKGVWFGMFLIAVCIGVTILPLFIYNFRILGYFPLFIAPITSAIIGIIVCYVSYQAAINSLQKLKLQY